MKQNLLKQLSLILLLVPTLSFAQAPQATLTIINKATHQHQERDRQAERRRHQRDRQAERRRHQRDRQAEHRRHGRDRQDERRRHHRHKHHQQGY